MIGFPYSFFSYFLILVLGTIKRAEDLVGAIKARPTVKAPAVAFGSILQASRVQLVHTAGKSCDGESPKRKLFELTFRPHSSWYPGACGTDNYCNALESNCVNNCQGSWIMFDSSPESTANPTIEPTSQPTISPAENNGNPLTPSPIFKATPTTSPSSQTVAPPVVQGELTWWTDSQGAVEGGSCEYSKAASVMNGATWLAPYLAPGFHCAVSDDLFQGGLGCGKCFHLYYSGVGGTNQAQEGSALIQVTNSGAGGSKHFDCFDGAFQALTGISTGIFTIDYYQVDCAYTPVTIVVLDGPNAYYTKVLVAGCHTSVKAMDITVGNNAKVPMYRNSGATWAASLTGTTGVSVGFDVIFEDDTLVTLVGCFGNGWPVSTGSQCRQ